MSEVKTKIAVLVSGSGSNLQAIIENVEKGSLNCEISYVIADRECYAVERAQKHKIRTAVFDKKLFGERLSDEINILLKNSSEEISYIILAGYLSILSKEFIQDWNRKIINIHPSLLPKYGGKGMYGLKVHKSVLKNNEKESGCTIHYVDSGIDTGEVIMKMKVPVFENDTPEILQKRILEKEHILLIEGIKKLISK
ncbi:MAG: phosphoribosylglycinamide formyltransferase [Leptotrichiaceae bacterium]|nr:phosphoribosylglycinamide formyltransferase [Leptotrichiaceae bacterium]